MSTFYDGSSVSHKVFYYSTIWYDLISISVSNIARDFDLVKSEKMLRNVSALIFQLNFSVDN